MDQSEGEEEAERSPGSLMQYVVDETRTRTQVMETEFH